LTPAAKTDKPVRHWRRAIALTLFAGLMLTALAFANSGRAAIETPSPPSVWSDKADYSPGEQVSLSGANWAPGESVHIRVNDDAGQTWSRDVDLTAAVDGTISDQFNLPDWFVAQYSVTAIGASSGTATWTFTDGNVTLHLPATEGVANMTVTFDRWNGNTSCTGTATLTNQTVTATSGGTVNIPGFGGAGDSVKLKSVTTTTTGRAFDNWTSGDNKTDSGTDLPGTPTPCISNSAGGSNGNVTDAYAHFKNSNSAPVCTNGGATTPEDTAKAITLSCTDADGNTLSYSIVSGPTNGGLSGSGASRTYTPSANFNGSDSFTFKANDGTVDSNVATFNITISAVNDAPTCANGSATTNEDTPKAVTLSCTDVEGNALTYSVVSTPAHGSVDAGTGANRTYTPAANYNGSDSFTFKANDGSVDSNTATFSLTITAVNDAPVADNKNATTNEDTAKTITLTGSDVDGDSLTFAKVAGPSHGTLGSIGTVTCTGTAPKSCSADVQYAPNANYNGSDSFIFKVNDGTADSSAATVSITVNAVNDDPTVARDNASVTVNEGQTAHNTGTFSDVDGDAVTFSASVGTVTKNDTDGTWSWSYTTDDGPSDSQTVTVNATDGHGGSASTTFGLVVDNVAPSATFNAPASVDEGSDIHVSLTSPSDPSGADAGAGFTYSFDCGSGYGAFGGTNSADCPTNDNGSRTVKGRIKDKDGGVSEYTASVAVANVAPTAELGNNGPVDEGSPATVSFTTKFDPSSADTTAGFHYQYHCDGSAFASPADYASASTSDSTQCTFDDNGMYTVRARIIDKDNGATSYTTDVKVDNVAPTVTDPSDQNADEGESFSYDLGSFTDPGSDSPWAVDVDWGDGTPHTMFNETSTGAITEHAHAYDDNGAYTVTVQVTDKDGASDSKTFKATIANVAPTVTLSGNATANEGDTKSYSYSWTDPGSADTFPAAGNSVDCGVNGTASNKVFDSTTQTGSFDCRWTDDSGAGTAGVSATVSDDDSGAGSDTIQVAVANVAPQVNLTGPSTADEGDVKTYSYTITDPGADDIFAFATSSYPTCGAYGQLVGTPAIGSGSFQCAFPDGPDTTNVAIKVEDDDGGVSTADSEHVEIIQVAVANVAPTVTPASDQSSNEGESKSFSLGSFSDPGTDSPWAVDVDWGDGTTPHTSFNQAATGAASDRTIGAHSHTYDDNGSYTVSVKVKDKNGEYDSKTFKVTVANVAPTATFSNDGPVNEGSSFHLSLSSPSDPSTADTTAGFTYAFDCGDGSGYGAYGASSTATCATTDDGTPGVKGKIKDKNDGVSEYTGSVTVNNVPPVVTGAGDQSSDEGENHSFTLGSFTDPGADTWTVDVDWGDGSPHSHPAVGSTGVIPATQHKYDDNGSYTGTVKVTDDDGGYDSKTFSVTVANVAPSGTLGDNGPVNESSSVTVSFSGVSDPSPADGASLHYAFDCNGGSLAGATYATASSTNSKSCTFDDGPSTPTVTGVIIDKDAGRRDGATTIEVKNVAPTATFSNDGPVNEGSSFHLALSSPSDPSTADTTAGFQYAFDCGDGSGYGTYSPSNSATCSTNDNGSRTVKGRVKDKDGGYAAYTANVTINNVDPTATFNAPSSVNEGSNISLSLTSPSDPSSADTSAGFQYAFDCGSGYGAYGSSNTASCSTNDNGTRTVKGKIKDKDGGYTSYTASVTINNVAPHITSVTATNTYAGPLVFMTSSIDTLFTDPGSADTWTNLLTFSDGGSQSSSTVTPQGGGAYRVTQTHSFTTSGCKTMTSRVTDDDGGFDVFGPTPVNVGTGEFLPPVTNTPVTNKLKGGQVLPVKIKLTDCNGAPVTGLNPAIALKKGDLTSVGDDSVVAITPGSVSNADTTGVMRSNGDGSYIYNMSVANMTLNTDYTLIVYPFGSGSANQYLAHVIQTTK
jgi:Bacterial Ig domain/PKD domain